MKEREIYADLRCAPPLIIRVDGRNFKKTLSRQNLEKPYDNKFASAMTDAIELFFKKSGISPVFAYSFSDEINLFFNDITFDGRVEKLDSVIPSFLSSALTMQMDTDEPLSFDSRIVPLTYRQIGEYMVWRQSEAWRNCINSYGYYTLLSEGWSENEAARHMKGLKSSDIHEMLFKRGINLAKVPQWHRRGIMVYKTKYEIEGFNPLLNQKTITTRKKIIQDWNIPLFQSEKGTAFLQEFID
ncbi:tRNA(His) guanylyltransferase Thg1 family protein [Methanohalobium sp.]|uniref:tRNA(His) guanylyltransferase Thg1 family protein n=1 Tax=Methanohalobium sp. TaxID=2837493 RepID=UPI0025DE1D8F|nr:tRNA(His) guanylyltransferase Thg1 family protein [Methanohalobium sp.]